MAGEIDRGGSIAALSAGNQSNARRWASVSFGTLSLRRNTIGRFCPVDGAVDDAWAVSVGLFPCAPELVRVVQCRAFIVGQNIAPGQLNFSLACLHVHGLR